MGEIKTTKNNLRAALEAEFPTEGHPEVQEAIDSAVRRHDRHRDPLREFDDFLNIWIITTA